MFYCDKATSVLFPQIDKVIQVYSCRITRLISCPFGSGYKCRKTQKTIRYKNDCVGPTPAPVESVHTDTDEEVSTKNDLDEICTNLCSTEGSEPTTDKAYKMYEIEKSTPCWEVPLTKGKNGIDKGKTNEYVNVSISKKIYRRKRRCQKTCKDTGVQSTKEKKISMKTKKEGSPFPNKMPSKLVNTKQTTFDKKSLISLYRKRKSSKLDKEKRCTCPFGDNEITEKDKFGKKGKPLTEKRDLGFKMKPTIGQEQNKQTGEENMLKSKLIDNTCLKGLCSKAMKMKDNDFVCSCEVKKRPEPPTVRCTKKSCNRENNVVKNSSVTSMKDKVSEVFRKLKTKYGRNVKIDPNAICEEGVCRDAYNQDNQDICCKCKLKVRKCTDTTCSPSKSSESCLATFCQKLQGKFKSRKLSKHSAKEHIEKNVVVQNEKEQTGDPFFEIKVNTVDMCVLNSSEIKDKVMCLGQEKKRDKCVCPSHPVKKRYVLKREACVDGVCHKALKNKKTDFACNCLKNKIWTCTDSTCNKLVTFKNNDNCPCGDNSSEDAKNYKPLFEVQVDSNKMCIINTDEMRNKIKDIKKRSNKLCRSGICKEKSKDRNTRIVCNCKHNMKYDECGEGTCRIEKRRNITQKCCRCGKPRNKKMVRGDLNSASLRNITSKFSCFCSRMICQSDNWENRKTKKRKRNSNRRCSMLSTQSENVHKRTGFKIMIKQHNDTQMKTDDKRYQKCCTCDYDNMMKPKNVEITKENVGDTIEAEKVTEPKNMVKSKRTKEPEEPKQTIKKKIVTPDTDKSIKQKPQKTKELPIKKKIVIPDTDKSIKQKPQKTKELPQPEKAHKRKVHQRNGVVVPVPSSNLAKNSSKIVKKKIQSICQCHNSFCECDLIMFRRKMKERRRKKRHQNFTHDKEKLEKKKKSMDYDKQWLKETEEKRKHFAKEREATMKQEEQRHKKQKEEEMEVLKLLESEDGARRTNCCIEIFGAVLSAGIQVVKVPIVALFKIITDPKGSYWYTRDRLEDPHGTYVVIKKVLRDGLRIRKLKITKCMKNSDTVSIISDTIKETPLYQAFVDKGKTKSEQQKHEAQTKMRKRRVRQRKDAALFGCRHVLLTTLRKTPCLWVYHVCPEFYPQCLSCLAFLRNFSHMCLFVVALACWTPCIACMEVMRALVCCLLCTG